MHSACRTQCAWSAVGGSDCATTGVAARTHCSHRHTDSLTRAPPRFAHVMSSLIRHPRRRRRRLSPAPPPALRPRLPPSRRDAVHRAAGRHVGKRRQHHHRTALRRTCTNTHRQTDKRAGEAARICSRLSFHRPTSLTVAAATVLVCCHCPTTRASGRFRPSVRRLVRSRRRSSTKTDARDHGHAQARKALASRTPPATSTCIAPVPFRSAHVQPPPAAVDTPPIVLY